MALAFACAIAAPPVADTAPAATAIPGRHFSAARHRMRIADACWFGANHSADNVFIAYAEGE